MLAAAPIEAEPAERRKPIARIPGRRAAARAGFASTRICTLTPSCRARRSKPSKRIADELTKAGAEVTPNVGKLGVVGVSKNGDGPVVLVRTDMDALPVVEETGLPYASKVTARDKPGVKSA